MAYNSDGYIMIDFTEVDFRRTNQTIEGLFDRCQKVIGTNKFVIVINANNKTPLPSTVSITNGQYVIESVLYTFSISSSDNLHITKKTTPEELIDDEHITLKTTWSSDKINDELEGKQDTLTPGEGIAIDNNVISADAALHIYSTTEQVVGTWIDGATLYEKTVSETIISSSSQVITTIAGAKYKRIEGFFVTSSGVVPVPFNDGSSRYVPYTDGDDVKLVKSAASAGVGNTIVLIIQYTKT